MSTHVCCRSCHQYARTHFEDRFFNVGFVVVPNHRWNRYMYTVVSPHCVYFHDFGGTNRTSLRFLVFQICCVFCFSIKFEDVLSSAKGPSFSSINHHAEVDRRSSEAQGAAPPSL